MFFIAVFIASWICYAMFAKKEKFLYTYPSALLAMLMSLSSDSLLRFVPLWEYHDVDTAWPHEMYTFMDDFGIYPVIGSLFVQYMPSTWKKWLLYMIGWTSCGIFVEWLLVHRSYMTYSANWSLLYSYAADWVIFGILSLQYRMHLRLLRSPRLDIDSSGKTAVYLAIGQEVQPVSQSAVLYNMSARGLTVFLGARNVDAETFCFLLEPETATDMHVHHGYELHYVFEGVLSVRKGHEQFCVKQGEICCFPPGLPHAFHNAGDKPCKVLAAVIKDEAFVPSSFGSAGP
jgi:quercetin dioxygenase-like cupin family protein